VTTPGPRPTAELVYRTGFISIDQPGREPPGPFRGASWAAELVAGPARIVDSQEVLIRARSWAAAQRAADLINGCRQLIHQDSALHDFQPVASNDAEPEWMDPQ
jgi:hypothetical protein